MTSSQSVARSAVLVVFGATGDLAHRKLYPALASLALQNRLPSHLAIIGVARTVMDGEQYGTEIHKAVLNAGISQDALSALEKLFVKCRYCQGSYDDPETFQRLSAMLQEADAEAGTAGNRLYYLATVPSAFATVAQGLGAAGLTQESDSSFCRIIVEKPFGRDLASSIELDKELHQVFQEHQIYRIDHYLAKETVQNIMALRFTNTIFEPLWNRRYVDHVEITVAEDLGVGHRGTFYESAGALRDIVQNHVLQVLSLFAMEPPADFDPDAIRDEKVKVLRAIRPLKYNAIQDSVVRGQYDVGVIDGEPVVAYRQEDGVSPKSKVETFVALRLYVDNWRWADVPFYIRTGKRLPKRVTEIALKYRPVPHLPLPLADVDSLDPNALVLTIQPDEAVEISFAAKVPGSPFRVRTVPLHFSYNQGFTERAPEAYERVLLDVFLGDPTLFIRSDEVQQAWRVVEPLITAFETGTVPLSLYQAGSWGPPEAADIMRDHNDTWREP